MNSAEERYRFLRKERPEVPLPAQITVFQWPGPITVLREVGVWQHIEDRVAGVGGDCAQTLPVTHSRTGSASSARTSSRLFAAAKGYETLWERPR